LPSGSVREQGDKTQLFAYTDEDGEPIEYVSGRRRDAREGLKPEFARRFVVKDHAEGHVAADMRRPGGPEHVTIVINNTPARPPSAVMPPSRTSSREMQQ
jgi:hypothetical protein